MSKVRIDLTLSEAAALADEILGGNLLGEINDKASSTETAERAAHKIRQNLNWVRDRRARRLG